MTPADPEIPARFCYKTACTGGAVATIQLHGLTADEQELLGEPAGAETAVMPLCGDHLKLFCYDMIFGGMSARAAAERRG